MNPAPLAAPEQIRVGIIGLGYVGLPLAVEFGRQLPTLGFDINAARIAELQAGRDHTREVGAAELASAAQLRYSADAAALAGCNVYIVTVPTPIDAAKRPDFTPLLAASRSVGRHLTRGDVVVFESTVYPGATEEVCIPVLEQESGLVYNVDFYAGYSPERINPGDHSRRLPDIVKITSGSAPAAADFVDALYRRIIRAGTHKASSIRVAEAAKVIENTQRDLNIALINELAQIFCKLGLDTQEVLQAAATKWNFLGFRPGLVGGHCIGVDPYYLTHKAQEIGHHPEVILAGRRINDGMGAHVAQRVMRLMTRRRIALVDARVLVLGLTFKENCPDLRNTRVVDVIAELRSYGIAVDVFDPCGDAAQARAEYGLDLLPGLPRDGGYDAIVLAVAHREFAELGAARLRACGRAGAVLFDVKSLLPREDVDERL
ncbi:nucleotide sugar dehydrogenase [Tahibacter harae]|uniref:Nucleotide sugar dehydrogenase n=1 Tax=Tahibacter harae TaxID=2963937 RepID=A0ABT1QV59_9GAMM|nr:nucleotide sugar dehydrogenase [Tahibacter harae]MCQ4166182.1 nucleotide sugar dehydrogenase [Tahibacter harae]